MNKNNIHNKNIDKGKVLAPEGGWGYAIAVSMIIIFIAAFSQFHSMGLLYGDFLSGIGEGVKGYGILMGVFNLNLSLSGIVANMALKSYCLRNVGYLGALLTFISWILTVFVTNFWQILITVGIIQPLGLGIITTVNLTSLTQYFDKKRMSVVGFCKMIIGLGNMVYPLLLNFLLETYGFRGTMLVQAAIVLNMFVAVALIQPVEWHQKKNNHNIIDENIPEKEEFLSKPIIQREKELLGMSHHYENDKDKNNETRGRARALSIVSTGLGAPCIEYDNKEPSIWKSLLELLDFNLFKDPIFCNICIGVSITVTIDVAFFSLVPLQLAANNYTKQQVAYCLSVVSGTDLLGRGLIGLIGRYVHFTSRTLCTLSLIGSFIFRMIYLHVEGFTLLLILAGILGFFRSAMAISSTIIYAEYIPEKFAAGFALQTLIFGVLGSIVTPGAGYLKDVTEDYTLTFHALNALSLFAIVPWMIEFFITWKRNKHEVKK